MYRTMICSSRHPSARLPRAALDGLRADGILTSLEFLPPLTNIASTLVVQRGTPSVPVEFLDKSGDPVNVTWSKSDNVTESKTVNLSGIAVRSINGNPCIYLSDLIRIGYQIYPERLANSVKAREGKAQEIIQTELRTDIQSAFEQLNMLELEK